MIDVSESGVYTYNITAVDIAEPVKIFQLHNEVRGECQTCFEIKTFDCWWMLYRADTLYFNDLELVSHYSLYCSKECLLLNLL